MEEAGYTFTNAHKRVHEIFIKRVAEYRVRYQAGEDIADELKNMLSRWLVNHIRGDDKAYAETIKRNLALRSKDRQHHEGWLKRFFGRRHAGNAG